MIRFIVHAAHHEHYDRILRMFALKRTECLMVYNLALCGHVGASEYHNRELYNYRALRCMQPEDPQYMHVYENYDSEDERCAKRHACEKHREKYAEKREDIGAVHD